MIECLFCKIVAGEVPSYQVWEDENHLAFLTIFPNTEGVTVVIPKEHHDSYIFGLPDEIMTNLMVATKKVANLLDKAFDDVERCGLVFEGYGINHIHAKLYPMHGTAGEKEWGNIESKLDTYFEKYPGYISSHDAAQAENEALQTTFDKIKKAL